MSAVPYNNTYFRIIAALSGTLVVLFQGRPFDLGEALHSQKFWKAFIASYLVALFLLYIIHHLIVRLDNKYPWNEDPLERFVQQVIRCFAAPLVIDFAVFAIYHYADGQNIFTNRFFPQDFLYVSLLLSLLNIYYFLHAQYYYWRKSTHLDTRLLSNDEHGKESFLDQDSEAHDSINVVNDEILEIRYKKSKIRLLPENIYCLYKSGNYTRVLTEDNNTYTTRESMNSLEARFQSKGLFRINREVIVNQKAIEGYQLGLTRNTLRLSIKHEFTTVEQNLRKDQLTVTKDHIQTIKAAFPDLSRIG